MYWNILSYLLLAILVVALIIYIPIAIKKWKTKKSGSLGEKLVANFLNRFAKTRGYKVINDIYLPLYDKTTQVDHILITYYGLFVIETKNYKGSVYVDPSQKEWTHIVGNDKNDMYNPILQNKTHIDCIRHIISKANIYNVKIENIVVFTDKKCELFVPKGLPIVKLNKLKKYLKQHQFAEDNDVDVNKLYNAIISAQVTDKSLIAKHNKNVKKMSKK